MQEKENAPGREQEIIARIETLEEKYTNMVLVLNNIDNRISSLLRFAEENIKTEINDL